MISTLQRLAGIRQDVVQASSSSINFNANLPINVEVLKQLDASRYRLKLGRKELTTKSHKPLREGEMYWGNFSQANGGILTLSQLYRQPTLFQNSAYFLDASLEAMIEIEQFSFASFKEALLEELLKENIDKTLFKTLSYMLLALNKGVVHLPFLHENKRSLIQFSLSSEGYNFYIASENLGPLEGKVRHEELHLSAMYEKSLYFLEKELPKLDMIATLSLRKEVHSLFDTHELSLDLKV